MAHARIVATRRAQKSFCRMNWKDKRTFYELSSLLMVYLFATWLKALRNNKSKLPPNFESSVVLSLECLERVLGRRDVRSVVDLRIGFDLELQRV
jgi:hypothetical protein